MAFIAYLVSAFGKNKNGGNPAGVVFLKDDLTNKEKQKIATVINVSETTFVEKGQNHTFKVSFFTPKKEIDFCGHATVATFGLMLKLKLIKNGQFKQKTNAGIISVKVSQDGLVLMDQLLPHFSEYIKPKEIIQILGCSKNNIEDTLAPQIVSTGLKDVFVCLKNKQILKQLKPDFNLMKKFNNKTDTVGFHVFCLSKGKYLATCRNFAPRYGILEESATGSSSGALACYLFSNKVINKNRAKKIIFSQGEFMNRPSEIAVTLTAKNDTITQVQVGGKARIIKKLKYN